MEFVLVRLLTIQLWGINHMADCAYLQIAKLCKSLSAAFEPTTVGLDPFMHYSVRLDIATLSEFSSAEVTGVRTLPRVAAFMRLQWISLCPATKLA